MVVLNEPKVCQHERPVGWAGWDPLTTQTHNELLKIAVLKQERLVGGAGWVPVTVHWQVIVLKEPKVW